LSASVVACENNERTEIRFQSTGGEVIGLQVAEGEPTFSDTADINSGELAVYEAVLSVVPHSADGSDDVGRVHVLLPQRSVDINTGGKAYQIILTSSAEEIAAAYFAQFLADWAYRKVAPHPPLASQLSDCATGIGRLYSHQSTLNPESVVQDYYPKLTPCVEATKRINELLSEGSEPDPDGAHGGDEGIPVTDDHPAQPIIKSPPPIIAVSPGAELDAKAIVKDAVRSDELESALTDVAEEASKIH
jgi:hypothetical protein